MTVAPCCNVTNGKPEFAASLFAADRLTRSRAHPPNVKLLQRQFAVNTEEKHLHVAESQREKNDTLLGEAIICPLNAVIANTSHKAAMTGDPRKMREEEIFLYFFPQWGDSQERGSGVWITKSGARVTQDERAVTPTTAGEIMYF